MAPAIFVMWMPAGFRLTCYYGRKAYYRALFGDPPACAVAEFCKPHYKGERGFWASRTCIATSYIWRCCWFACTSTTSLRRAVGRRKVAG